MPLLPDKKIAFLHIPKTGGTSITKKMKFETPRFTKENGLYYDDFHVTVEQMLSLSTINCLDREEFMSYFKFTFVRNPWDRLISEYSNIWRRRIPIFEDFLQQVQTAVEKHENNEEFITSDVTTWPNNKVIECHWAPQYKFITLNGKMIMDFIGRFENFEEDTNKVFKLMEVSSNELEYLNFSSHDYYKSYYNSYTEEKVREIYRKDIEMFDYKF